MTSIGFTIAKVVVQGQGKPDALLEFGPGLNVIAGRTRQDLRGQLAISCSEHEATERDSVGTGYTHSWIEISPRDGESLTLRRALEGGRATAYMVSFAEIADETPFKTLGEQHSPKNPFTISGYLLALSNLDGKQIRKNQDGAKRSLSFRMWRGWPR